MVIPGIGVHEAQELISGCGVDRLIDPGKREWVLWAGLVQVGEIDADSPLPVLLFDQDRVGQPFRVKRYPDEPCF